MPVATGGARPDIIGIGTAPVLAGSTHTGASAGMAVAGIARALKTSAAGTRGALQLPSGAGRQDQAQFERDDASRFCRSCLK